MAFELNTVKTVAVESRFLSGPALSKVKQLVHDAGSCICNPDEYGDEDFWVFENDRGKLAKRIAKRVKARDGITLSNEMLGVIGSIIGDAQNVGETYYYDITDNFDWKPGTFGESTSSCYWGGYRGARAMMKREGALALRLYGDEGRYGIARAWFYEVEPDAYILWNGYGGDFGDPTKGFANILATLTDKQYARIHLENNGAHSNGPLYINGSGHAYIIADKDTVESGKYARHDFRWEDDHVRICNGCLAEYLTSEMKQVNGYYYCEACSADRLQTCHHCGTDCRKNSSLVINGHQYCETCFGEVARTCTWCGLYGVKSEMHRARGTGVVRYIHGGACLRASSRANGYHL